MKTILHFPGNRNQDRRGIALVLVLAFVVLVTGLVVAFFSRALVGRQVSDSSASQTKASLLAQSAAEIIVGNLKQEIVNGSTLSSTNNFTIYTPASAANLLPVRSGNPVPDTIPNLVRRSVRSDPISSPGVTSLASAVSSTDASINGRSISTARWNGHYLIPRSDMGNSIDTTPNKSANFTAPDWVIVTRAGPEAFAGWDGSLSNRSSSNSRYAVGRYAYAIYDEGGLLDMNVAGYPSGVTSAQIGQKGYLALADLTQLFPSLTSAQAQAQIDNIVGWRNYATAQPGGYFGNFTFGATSGSNWLNNFVLSNTTGFTKVSGTVASSGQTDQALLSRQELIKLALSGTAVAAASQDALQYMGTFSRALNAPSFTPATVNAFNPSLINQRVTASFTRDDGTTAQIGEPLLKHRFPLSRLALITRNATATAADTDPIYKYFGLSRASTNASWVYNHGDPDKILRLSEVATAGREPDFFELLQAGIIQGSLGKNSKAMTDTTVTDLFNTNTCFQIIQIGLNVIDQYGSDSYPTTASFKNTEFSGTKNLPYLTRVFEAYCRFPGNSTVPEYSGTFNRPNVGGWYQAEVWNPHQQGSLTPVPGPSQFRFIATGASCVESFQWPGSPAGVAYITDSLWNSPIKTFSLTDPGVVFSGTNTYTEPRLLSPATGATATGEDSVIYNGSVYFVGLYCGASPAPDLTLNPTYKNANLPATDAANAGKLDPALYYMTGACINPQGSMNFYLQYKVPAGDPQYTAANGGWVTYCRMEDTNGAMNCSDPNSFVAYNISNNNGCFRMWPDPRTSRFGPTGSFIYDQPSPSNYGGPPGRTLRPDSATSGYGTYLGVSDSAGWTYSPPYLGLGSTKTGYFGCLTENTSASQTHYTDPDGVLRQGDGAYASGGYGQPLTQPQPNYNSRPVMLNRPFRSVAEMGYAFRGMPWKSLDFCTANSGDAALLDLFCLQESPADSVIAGILNLNTRQQPVLKAVLSGAIKDTLDPTTGITSSDLSMLLNTLTSITSGTPLINRSELVTRLGPKLLYSTTRDKAIKPRREATARALSDVADTRTWNLLIDVVAQSGRYPSTATKLSQFLVEGERHYWLHVALDRFTGLVISQSMEPVYE